MLSYCQLDPCKQISMKFESKYEDLSKWMWKYLQTGGHFVSTSTWWCDKRVCIVLCDSQIDYVNPVFRQICMCCVCGVMTIMMATLLATPYGGKAMFFIWICVIFLTFSGNFALFPTVTARAFGPKYVAINFGLVFSSQVSILLQWHHITMTSWHGHTFCVASYWCFVKAALDSLTKG